MTIKTTDQDLDAWIEKQRTWTPENTDSAHVGCGLSIENVARI